MLSIQMKDGQNLTDAHRVTDLFTQIYTSSKIDNRILRLSPCTEQHSSNSDFFSLNRLDKSISIRFNFYVKLSFR
ncbi:hypothetical protein D3C73_1370190 [compost metagenome]